MLEAGTQHTMSEPSPKSEDAPASANSTTLPAPLSRMPLPHFLRMVIPTLTPQCFPAATAEHQVGKSCPVQNVSNAAAFGSHQTRLPYFSQDAADADIGLGRPVRCPNAENRSGRKHCGACCSRRPHRDICCWHLSAPGFEDQVERRLCRLADLRKACLSAYLRQSRLACLRSQDMGAFLRDCMGAAQPG